MLGIDSTRFGDWKLVVAGDPDNSYLMVLLTGVGGPLGDEVGTMPYNNPRLCDPKNRGHTAVDHRPLTPCPH
ncbi:MAG: hypothetical protein GY811_20975 [Myxococcales bacterium]|nr:hypothetical protein [Myxococcales bacterium]